MLRQSSRALGTIAVLSIVCIAHAGWLDLFSHKHTNYPSHSKSTQTMSSTKSAKFRFQAAERTDNEEPVEYNINTVVRLRRPRSTGLLTRRSAVRNRHYLNRKRNNVKRRRRRHHPKRARYHIERRKRATTTYRSRHRTKHRTTAKKIVRRRQRRRRHIAPDKRALLARRRRSNNRRVFGRSRRLGRHRRLNSGSGISHRTQRRHKGRRAINHRRRVSKKTHLPTQHHRQRYSRHIRKRTGGFSRNRRHRRKEVKRLRRLKSRASQKRRRRHRSFSGRARPRHQKLQIKKRKVLPPSEQKSPKGEHLIYTRKYPRLCSCKLAKGLHNGACYYYTNSSYSRCRRRKCRPSYVCVQGYYTGMKCMLRKITSRVVYYGYGKCKTKRTLNYTYTLYIM